MSVPEDVAAGWVPSDGPPEDVMTRCLAGPGLGGFVDGMWRSGHDGNLELRLPGGWSGKWWVLDCGFPLVEQDEVRAFTTWDEVRVALDEVEERGSWWPEP